MKKLFFLCAVVLVSFNSFAQFQGDIDVINTTNCDVEYELFTSKRPKACDEPNASPKLTIPANTTVKYNLLGVGNPAPAWIAPIPIPGSGHVWTGARVGFNNCGYYISVGTICGFVGTGGTVGDPSCNPCQFVNVLWDAANQQLLIY